MRELNSPISAVEAAATAPLAERWLAAWNAHDMAQILSLHAADAEHTSARVRALGGRR